jgi:hypothetical protein
MGLSFSKSGSSSSSNNQKNCTIVNGETKCTSTHNEESSSYNNNKTIYISIGAIILTLGCFMLVIYSINALKQNSSDPQSQIKNNRIANNSNYLFCAMLLTVIGAILTLLGVKAD